MARLSLRLPDTLHQQLSSQARSEGVSLNQYLVFLLARYSGSAFSMRSVEQSTEEQWTAFAELRRRLGSASHEDNTKALADLREPGPVDPELTPELMERFQRLRRAKSRGVART
jgi:predicted  nucleic acid-binding Zn-ribbon protein